jgi:hypothetical protein
MSRSVAREAQRVPAVRTALLCGVALFVLGTALGARAQQPPSASESRPLQQAPAEQQQSPSAQPAPVDQPPAQQVPVPMQPPAVSLPEVAVSARQPAPKPAAGERRAPPTAAAPAARVTRTPPSAAATPASAPGTNAPEAVLDQKMQVMDRARDDLLPKLGASTSTIDRGAIEAMPQGDNTPIDKVILQLPGVSYDSAVANPNFHVQRVLVY